MSHPFQRSSAPTPLVAPWGPLATVVADLVRHAPALAWRLTLLPARGMHATAVTLHASAAAGEVTADLARRLADTHPRLLLRDAMPDTHPRLYRLLDRAPAPAWNAERNADLNTLLHSPAAEIVLDAADVTPDLIGETRRLLAQDPLVRRARRALTTGYQREQFAAVVAVLRGLGLLRDLLGLPDGAGARAVARRVRADFGRAVAPDDDGFPIPAGWVRITRLGDLWAHGKRLRLCLDATHYGAGRYALRLISGASVFLHHAGEDAVAEVHRGPGDTWRIEEVRKRSNALVRDSVRRALVADLAAAGLVLLASDPANALDAVLRPPPPRRRDLAEAEDDPADDEADQEEGGPGDDLERAA